MSSEVSPNLLRAVKILFNNKKWIILFTLAAAILTAIASLFLDNYYKSTTTFYPVNPSLASPNVIFGKSENDLLLFGGDDEIDHLITIAESKELADHAIEKFGLFETFKIDPEKKRAVHKARKEFAEIFKVKKNKYSAVELSVEDKDAEKASLMSNHLREKVDTINMRINRVKQNKLMYTYQQAIAEMNQKISKLSEEIKQERIKYGIFDVENQGIALASRNDKSEISRFMEGRELIATKSYQLEKLSEDLSTQMDLYSKLRSAFNAGISTIHLFEPGDIPDYKSRPKRSLLVIGAGFFAFLLSAFAILLLNFYRRLDWDSIDA